MLRFSRIRGIIGLQLPGKNAWLHPFDIFCKKSQHRSIFKSFVNIEIIGARIVELIDFFQHLIHLFIYNAVSQDVSHRHYLSTKHLINHSLDFVTKSSRHSHKYEKVGSLKTLIKPISKNSREISDRLVSRHRCIHRHYICLDTLTNVNNILSK